MREDDCKASVVAALGSLTTFWSLIESRRRAALRGVPLSTFLVRGRWLLAGDGTVKRVFKLDGGRQQSIGDQLRDVPDVLGYAEFEAHVRKALGLPLTAAVLTTSYVSTEWVPVPRPGIGCVICHQPWRMGNASDCVVVADPPQRVSLARFTGHTPDYLQGVLDARGAERGASYRIHPERVIRSDRFIAPGGARKTGWVGWGTLPDDYLIQPGDEGAVVRELYWHRFCWQLMHETEVWKLLNDAGFALSTPLICVADRPPFWDSFHPWFEARTTVGLIRIGRRRDGTFGIHCQGSGRRGRRIRRQFPLAVRDGGQYETTLRSADVATDLRRLRKALE